MITADFHVHSTFSDGKDSLDGIAAVAYDSGMAALGFSDHGYAPYDTACCVPRERIAEYRQACRRLRREYAGRMDIFCGIEQDLFSEEPTDGYDYVIGSVHYLYLNGEYLSVDWKREPLDRAAELLGGDMLATAWYPRWRIAPAAS